MSTAEAAPALAQEQIYIGLDRIATENSYVEQWRHLEWLRTAAHRHPELSPILVDYAARPGGSLLFRAYALDIGVQSAMGAVVWDRATSQQQEICDQMRRVAPEYFDPAVRADLNSNPSSFEAEWRGAEYFRFFASIAQAEGINQQLIVPNYYDVDYWPEDVPTNVPVAPSLLLRRLMDGTHALDLNNLPPTVARDALELALDFRSDAYQRSVTAGEYPAAAQFARLWQLTEAGGPEHDTPFDDLYMSGPEGVVYAEALHRLSESVPLLADLFSWIPAEAITRGVRSLVANVFFGLRHYRENGNHIDTKIFFADGGAPIGVQEDNPLELLKALTQAFRQGHYDVMHYPPVFAPGNEDFHHCRFGNNTSYHGRPFGDEAFDPQYEFAGDSTGRYRVKLDADDRPISFLNAEQTPGTICFRFDFDRFGPALDVGAIGGNPYISDQNNLEMRIGRFLALGNYLRCKQLEQAPTMNHVRRFRITPLDSAVGILRHKQLLRERASAAAGTTALLASG